MAVSGRPPGPGPAAGPAVRRRNDGQENGERAIAVITSALLDRIGRGEIGPGGRVPPVPMTDAAVVAGIGAGPVRYALGELVTAGVLRLVPGHGYYLSSRARLAAVAKAGAR